ncbi:CCR4-NOT transcription complex subunit 10, partial [Cucurbita argyrosperma subsp. sororia]
MDARDSSSSTTPNRDGSSSAVEDDGAVPVTAALAKEAASLFQSGKYAGCVEVLNQLLQKKEDDPKVLHNIAISEYLRDGCSNPKKLLEVLNNVKKKSENLAISSGEQTDALNPENKNTLGKGSNLSAHQTAANNADVMYMEEFDASIATLNIAIVWFNLHEYAKALAVLEPLYQNIEPIYETTALRICFLLLDVGLASRDASLSADVLLYLEKAFGITNAIQSETGSTGAQQSTNVVAKSSSVPSNASASEPSNTDIAVNSLESPLSRTLSEETFEYESMLSTLDIGGQNLPAQAGFSSSNVLLRTPVYRSLSTVDLKLKLQLYKVRFLLLTRNLKQAKREAKHAMNIARGIDSSMALLLKAELEYARGNHRKAMKLLLASGNRTDMGISSMLNNNLGCIYNQLGKYHTSTVVFSKAVSSSSALWKDKKPKTVSQDNSLLIVYNCGVQYLACGKPLLAARCFQKAGLIFYNRSLLWLRLAECCLMALEMGLLKDNLAESDRSDLKVHVVGKGRWRQLVLEDGISKNGCAFSSGKEAGHFSSEGQPKLSISFARQCLSNALYLLNHSKTSFSNSVVASNSSLEEKDSSEVAPSRRNYKNLHCIDSKASLVTSGSNQISSNGDAKEQKGASSIQELVQNSLSYYDEITRRENLLIKQALLANLAYVELKLGNPLRALTLGRSILELPECSKVYTFLGHVYAAEALCLLNRPKEAAQHLLYYLSEGTNFKLPFSQEDCEVWRVDGTADLEGANGGSTTANSSSQDDPHGMKFLRPEEARAVLFANFATVSALQGEFKQAQEFVSEALSIIPNSPEANMTAVYVDLALGKSQEAIAKLKQCSCVRFLPSGLTMERSS